METIYYCSSHAHSILTTPDRAQLQEQNALSEEIVNAITSNQIGEPIDEDELDNELEAMQQEQLDEQMLKTGTVPVSDSIHRLPTVANGKSKSLCLRYKVCAMLTGSNSRDTCGRGGRRGGRAQKVASRDGHVVVLPFIPAFCQPIMALQMRA